MGTEGSWRSCGWRLLLLVLLGVGATFAAGGSWTGVVMDGAGAPVADATVVLHVESGSHEYRATTGAKGEFSFALIAAGKYRVSVLAGGKESASAEPVNVTDDLRLTMELRISGQDGTLQVVAAEGKSGAAKQSLHLSDKQVSNLPLNTRDFSKLLLLAAGTMTDTNGTANFTQQFSVNGQRGVESVFATDGTDTSDPEMGGATFSNLNVDAIQEVQSSSGVMPPEIGRGSAMFTNVATKSGADEFHGSAFEFVRNAAFDAHNFFDHVNPLDPRRIPPFVRNEFGGTIGGPLVIPGMYDGRGKTYFFGEYQGFRQVLGTTQVLAVPTADERKGIDTTAYPGDTLYVPVSAAITPLLARYPLPNDPTGSFGARTYATSSKVVTDTNQFSTRIDQMLTDKARLFGRFSLNQVSGPTTNPDQTAIDPSFGVNFYDHQRSATVNYQQALTAKLNLNAAFGYVRSTPIFPTTNAVDPALAYGDGLYVGFNSADGAIFGSYGNVYQAKVDMSWSKGAHELKWGFEVRFNKDATVYGMNPNGVYTFGGGTAYSPVAITSASGQHNIAVGDALPDALTGLLTATPYSYTVTAASDGVPKGDKFDEAAVRREAYNFYVQDGWKISPRWSMTYGLRYEVNSTIKEAKHRTSVGYAVDAAGNVVPFYTPGAQQVYLYNPQPIYPTDWGGFGPRVAVDFAATKKTMWHAGGAITTLLPNLWQDNFVTGGFPLIFQPLVAAKSGTRVPFSNTALALTLPAAYDTQGRVLFPGGDSSKVPANTAIDVARYQRDVEALTPGDETQLISTGIISREFRNGYFATFTLGFDHDFGIVKWNAAYVGTVAVHLANVFPANGYAGADAGYAPLTEFNAVGQAIGGYGPEMMMQSGAHSTYHSLQTGVTRSSARWGLGFQANYTYSKSLDDVSNPMGGGSNAGATVQAQPQDPFNVRAEKGPSTFDVTQAFSLSLIQALPMDRLEFMDRLSKKVTAGWQLLNVTSISTGPPFTVYSGIQQTGAGAGGVDRPDMMEKPDFSTSRAAREDYFGRSANNYSFFSIPIGVSGGTGPNQGYFGTLGRDTFRGPGLCQFDFALIKNTPFGRRGSGEWGVLQFRAEFFNIFNIVNFGLPSNTVRGSGFGLISKTAGSSRQIQFSLKLAF